MSEHALIPAGAAAVEADWQSWAYEDFVRAGREVASRSAWLYGDLAAAVETQYGEHTLGRYAADIGVEYSTLRAYKAVAEAYPQSVRRITSSWTVHQAFAAQPDRLELVASREWTVAQARELVGSRRTPAPLPPSPQPILGPPGTPELSEPDDTGSESFSWPAEPHRDTDPGWGPLPPSSPHPPPSPAPPGYPPGTGTVGAHVGHNSGDNEWYTPEEYIKHATAVMGAIDLDPASSQIANSRVRAAEFYTEDDDGLSLPWSGRVWMNPPYAQPLVTQFCERLAESYMSGSVTEACVLVNNATETRWFQALADVASAMCFPRGRVKFWHPSKEAVPLQGQTVIYLGTRPDEFRGEFAHFGFVVSL